MLSHNARRVLPIGLTLLTVAAGAAWYLWPPADPLVQKIGVSIRPTAKWPAPDSVAVFRSPEELYAAFPRANVQLDRHIDFERECLVRVGWQTAGTLSAKRACVSAPSERVWFGTLQCSARMAGRRITFYVQEPRQYGTIRAVFQRVLGDEWFTAPKHAQITFDSPWAIAVHEGWFLLGSAALLGLGLAAGRTRPGRLAARARQPAGLSAAEEPLCPSAASTPEAPELCDTT